MGQIDRTSLNDCGFCGALAMRPYPSDPEFVWIFRTWSILMHEYVSCCVRCGTGRLNVRMPHMLKIRKDEVI